MLTKKEAAELLGVSPRTFERFQAKGRINAGYREGKKGREAVYDPAEVRRLKAELEAPPAVVVPPPPATSLVRQSPDAALSPIASAFAQVAEAMRHALASARPVPFSEKLLLTVKEAVEYAGASESAIRAAIDAGRLRSSKLGPRGSLVVKRADLEAWVKKL